MSKAKKIVDRIISDSGSETVDIPDQVMDVIERTIEGKDQEETEHIVKKFLGRYGVYDVNSDTAN